MKTNWDYTNLADAYLKRPEYAANVIDSIVAMAQLDPGSSRICDIGAGVGHLSLEFLQRGIAVTAIEPNDAMRSHLLSRVSQFKHAKVAEAVAEDTRQQAASFDLVSFGSSFNVTDRQAALREAARILKPKGWFFCLWNHRDLEDKVQSQIESIIKVVLPTYDYGTRREDQTSVITESGLFTSVQRLEGRVKHEQSVSDCIEAWRSHATLERQAGTRFKEIIHKIELYLRSLGIEELQIPYITRAWAAQKIS